MKIGILSPNSIEAYGGVEVHFKNLVFALKMHGHSVQVFTSPKIFNPNLFFKIFRYIIIKYTPFEILLSAFLINKYHQKKMMECDIIITTCTYGYFVRHKKLITIIHGYYKEIAYSMRKLVSVKTYLYLRIWGYLQKKSCKKSYKVVTVSKFNDCWLKKDGICVDAIIPNGIDTDFFKYDSSWKDRLRSYCLPDEYFLYVGRIELRKNFDIVAKYAIEEKKNLVVICDKTVDEGTIFYRSNVPLEDLPAFYSGAKILFHPAYHEGFCIVVAEAMSCLTPVIFTLTGIGPEIEKKIPDFILGSPDDFDSLKKMVPRILEKRVLLGAIARQIVVENYTKKIFEDKWIFLISSEDNNK